MAEYFAKNGWNDITIAFPVNIREIDQINNLTTAIKLNLLVENTETVDFLERNLLNRCDIYVKIDTGAGRCGILPEDTVSLDKMMNKLSQSKKNQFKGFLTHAGHTYNQTSLKVIESIHNNCVIQLNEIKERYKNDFSEIMISVGDTPSCSLISEFSGIDEIRPGNFIFYDLMQYYIGSCNFENIAVVLAVPVVAKNSFRNEITVYGGAVHLSKEFVVSPDNKRTYGAVVNIYEDKWSKPLSDTYIKALSQEHGIIKTNPDIFEQIKIGDLLGIVPVHSCLTADLMRDYYTLGNNKIEMMPKTNV